MEDKSNMNGQTIWFKLFQVENNDRLSIILNLPVASLRHKSAEKDKKLYNMTRNVFRTPKLRGSRNKKSQEKLSIFPGNFEKSLGKFPGNLPGNSREFPNFFLGRETLMMISVIALVLNP